MQQITNQILMVRPAAFGFNHQTAASNSFQVNDDRLTANEIIAKAIEEFDKVVETLMACDVQVHVVQDSESPRKPDSLFPNNWVSFHCDGTIVTYPMMSSLRRQEIRSDVLRDLQAEFSFEEVWRLDQEFLPDKQFLEGTGSMVLDRVHRIAYACRSPRTSQLVLQRFCERFNFRPVIFDSAYSDGVPVYHTNVIMAVTERHVILCMDSIADTNQRSEICDSISRSEKRLVEISLDQVGKFAGNMLQIGRPGRRPILVMSRSARNCLTDGQVAILEDESDLLAMPIPVIETYGGGSIRCMLAEIFTA